MESVTIKLNGWQASQLAERIAQVLHQNISLWLPEPQNDTTTPYGTIHPCDVGHLTNAIIAALGEPIEPPDPEKCIKDGVTNRESRQALRILMGSDGSDDAREACSVCWNRIDPGDEITDMYGKNWPIHRGDCARHAGVPDDGFEPGPYRLYGGE